MLPYFKTSTTGKENSGKHILKRYKILEKSKNSAGIKFPARKKV